MKNLEFKSKNALLSLLCLFITLFLLAPCQEASSADGAAVVETLNGKVVIKLEPHGSIRAKVFQGQTLQYEFLLDRETQQKLLTQTIDSANIYLAGKHRDELIIDDLKTQKRYSLSMVDGASKLKNVPSTRNQTIPIKGYSVTILQK